MDKHKLLVSVEEVLEILLSQANCLLKTTTKPIEGCLGFTLAENIISAINIPPKDNSSVDGYAFNVSDWEGKPLPLGGRICAGDVSPPLKTGTIVQIFTGAQIPQGANCVVIQEECEEIDAQVEVFCAADIGENIRKQGEDIRSGEVVLKKGQKIRPQEIGLLAAIGLQNVVVYRPLKVAIFSTGNEIINPGTPLKTGQIYNSNRWTLRGLLADMVVKVLDLGIIADNYQATEQALQNASEQADLIITSGGVSVGQEDHIKTALANLGELIVWKVKMKPGKPLAFGKIGRAFLLGLPGNPVSTFAVFNLLVRPFMAILMGQISYSQAQYELEADFNWRQKSDRREYLRAQQFGKKVVIYPHQGSAVLSSVVWADGFCQLERGCTIKKGQKVIFIPFSQWGRV